ncbi:N/A [soil metagenome]
MIFLTVGTQLPFDRLIRLVDDAALGLDEEIFGQIGKRSELPLNFPSSPNLDPREFERQMAAARVIISHAGIGSILSARKHRKPIVLFPRRVAFGEHRNDHQLATCAQLIGRPGIYVAYDDDELTQLLHRRDLDAGDERSGQDDKRSDLTRRIAQFIQASR